MLMAAPLSRRCGCDRLLDRRHEDLAVADLAGVGRALDRLHGLVRAVGDNHLSFIRHGATRTSRADKSPCPFCRPKPFTSLTVSPLIRLGQRRTHSA
jgi:hypothetical protein